MYFVFEKLLFCLLLSTEVSSWNGDVDADLNDQVAYLSSVTWCMQCYSVKPIGEFCSPLRRRFVGLLKQSVDQRNNAIPAGIACSLV